MDEIAHASSGGRYGDSDVPQVATLFGEPSRVRLLMALADGHALPASRLAAEAGLSAPAASAQLARLLSAGLIVAEPSGRYRFYRLADANVAAVLEAMAVIAPASPVRSLREGTPANAIRTARTCYDHLAGRLGVTVASALVTQQALVTTDGIPTNQRRNGDRLSAPVAQHPYQLGPNASELFDRVGVDLAALQHDSRKTTRPLLRFCLDWTEQQHHIAGRLGAALLNAFIGNKWITHEDRRVIRLTTLGASQLEKNLNIENLSQ
jgi:DNA-binding transcriptional ArsR family regulator